MFSVPSSIFYALSHSQLFVLQNMITQRGGGRWVALFALTCCVAFFLGHLGNAQPPPYPGDDAEFPVLEQYADDLESYLKSQGAMKRYSSFGDLTFPDNELCSRCWHLFAVCLACRS